ncbi:hypothetical protein XENOCAPTIV_026840 [Xenoophorus captivus]|uniref:HAT C-terminal dimerisation domain-containing protein n=1 Tax=Xenoophorus captivus TaxID=1517983 RepID=A0ABV0RAT9_9TELE
MYSDVIREIMELKEQGPPREVQVDSSSTAGKPDASGRSRKKSAMAELFGEFFPTEKETTKPLSQITGEEVMSYRLTDCIPVDAEPLAWWKNNEHKCPHIAKLAQQSKVHLYQVREFSLQQRTLSLQVWFTLHFILMTSVLFILFCYFR